MPRPAVNTRAAPSGARSGALLAVASAASIVANYIFLLSSGRILGSDRYGSLAALLGLLAVVVVPATSLQMAVSREISRRVASGDADGADRLAHGALRISALATAPLLALAFTLAVPLSHLLHIPSVGIVVLAESTLVTAFVLPAAMGVMQGFQRFHALAAMYLLPQLLRLVLFAVAVAVGLRLGGAVFATMAAITLGTAVVVVLVREPLGRGRLRPRPDLRPFLRYLTPVAAGLIGVALLTHVDILIVKARLSGDDAGAYGAASAFARVGFFLPATVLAVLFPRTAARQARGEETQDILGRTLLATAAFCGTLALVYAASGVGLISTTFGSDFAAGGRVLGPFAVAIGLYSLANVLVAYHLSRGETRYAWIVGGAVVVQVAVLATIPTTLHGFVWMNAAVAGALLVAHEVLVESSAPALRVALRRLSGVWTDARAVLPETLLVLIACTAFVCALFFRVVVHFQSTIIGSPGSDSTSAVAWLWTLHHEGGYHLLGSVHHTFSGAPFGWNETNGVNVQWFLPYYPAYLLTKIVGEVAAYNLVVLSGYVLSGAAMYLLLRYLGCARLVCAWGAMVFIVFPWHLERVEHGSLVHVEVFPLLFLALVAAYRRPSWLRFAFVGAAVLACWLTSGYYGAIAVITTMAFAIGVALTTRARRWFLVLAPTASALVATAIVGVGAVAAGTNTGAGLNRVAGDLSVLGLRPYELVVPAAHNILFGSHLLSFWSTRIESNLTEQTNYLGLLTIALAIAWLVLVSRRADDRRWLAAGLGVTFVVGFLFALPSPFHGIPMPSRLLFAFVPAFRVPARWDPLLVATAVTLAALALDRVWRALSARRIAVAVAAVAAAMVVSFFELAIHPAQARFRTRPVPPEYVAVAHTPPGTVAEYPLGYSDVFRLWQRRYGRPLVNGAARGTIADQARQVVLDPTVPGTASALALLGVTTIVIEQHAVVDAEVQPRPPGDGYALVGRFPDGASVWRVVAPPAPAFVTLPGGFTPPRRLPNGLVGFPLVAPGGVAELEVRAKTAATVRLTFDAEPPSGSSRSLRLSDGTHEHAWTVGASAHLTVTVDVPRGVSRLLVKTDPPAKSEADAVVISAPRAEPTTSAPLLHAQPVSPDPGF